jgi:SHS2 domain-containing protein
VRAPFEIIEHPADVGFIAYGSTLEELFANAALALLSLSCELSGIEEREQREILVQSADLESLLYAWLAEILAISDAEQLVFRRVELKCLRVEETGGEVRGEVQGIAHGEPFDKTRHRAGTYIKAVTYHQFEVTRTPDGWSAQVFLDL